MQVNCEHCGIAFKAKRSTAKYCGPKCRKDAFDARRISVPNVKNANSSVIPPVNEVVMVLQELIEQAKQQTENSGMALGNLEGIEAQLRSIDERLARLEHEPRAAAAPQRELAPMRPMSDDDLLDSIEITEAKSDGTSADNFIRSMLALQHTAKSKENDDE